MPAWSRNVTSKQAGRPKLHLVDSGLAARLTGQTPARLADPVNAAFGPLLETFVAGELARAATWSQTRPALHHLRDRGGVEVDLVLEASMPELRVRTLRQDVVVRSPRSGWSGRCRLGAAPGPRWRTGAGGKRGTVSPD